MPTKTDLDRFRQLVWADESLAARLWAVTDRHSFASLVSRLALERELVVSESEVLSAMASGGQAWLALWNV